MNIFIIGQCSLQWGRMEYGNIGNYYIIEPLIRELHRVFPNCKIKTTMQMSDRFCKEENVNSVPLQLYYNWNNTDLPNAINELEIALQYKESGKLDETTPYIKEILASDLIIDFSGDIWGDNADFLGKDRFKVGLIKDRIAQIIGKKIVMIAGSPGPFSNEETIEFAKEVYSGFDLVTNREPVSTELLYAQGFDISKTRDFACPAFLFEGAKDDELDKILSKDDLERLDSSKTVAGFIICGWNFINGPFDLWPRDDSEYIIFAKTIEHLTENLGVTVCLMSHSNGFDPPPEPFRLKHGRDYPIAKQLERVLTERGIAKDFFTLNGIYNPWQTKAIIRNFDILISGRVHGAVAGISEHVPTIIIDYGHQPKAHKLNGFAEVAGVREYVADPTNIQELKQKIEKCLSSMNAYKFHLEKHIPIVKKAAEDNFNILRDLF